MPKPTPTNEDIKARPIEQDDFPPPPVDDPLAPVAAAAPAEGAAVNSGYGVPGDAGETRDTPRSSILEHANRVLADATARVHPPIGQQHTGAPVDATRRPVMPAGLKFANEAYAPDMLDQPNEPVLDLMVSNVVALQMVEPSDPKNFREFIAGEMHKTGERNVIINGEIITEDVFKSDGQLLYEKFMLEPVVVRIHSTKDKNEPPLVFVGINGDNRWLPRNRAIKLPRKFVERLAQAQEMAFETKENKDMTVDNAMTISRSIAQAYEFSVLDDPSPIGRRWLARMVRSGS